MPSLVVHTFWPECNTEDQATEHNHLGFWEVVFAVSFFELAINALPI
jgi:hypothetical protein